MSAELSAADDGATIAIAAGEAAVIRLAENGSTGYRWTAESDTLAIATVAAGEAHYPPAAIGGGGTVTFRIEARAPGTCRVHFREWRPWEGEGSIVARVTLAVTVTG